MTSPAFADLLADHAGRAVCRQMALADWLGDHDWNADLAAGTIDFGGGRVFPAQLLGTESRGDDSWLWAWANAASGFPPAVLEDAGAVRALGEERGVPELTDRSFPLDRADGHRLATVACGLLEDRVYYVGNHDAGAAVLLVRDPPAEALAPPNPERAMTVLMQTVGQFEVDHRQAARAFFPAVGYTLSHSSESGDALTASPPPGTATAGDLHLTFDDRGRLADLRGTLGPGGGPGGGKKPWWKMW